MKPSSIDKHLPLLADLAFALYLATEIIFEHTIWSQLGMLLLFAVTAIYVFRQKRLFFSWWMLAGALVVQSGTLIYWCGNMSARVNRLESDVGRCEARLHDHELGAKTPTPPPATVTP